jgi:hypothetical protein
MNILLDQGTPVHLRHWLTAHWVSTTYEQGWSSATNQDLFLWAGQLGYRLVVSTDINLRYQQNLQPHTLAILVLSTSSWPRIRTAVEQMAAVVAGIRPGEYCELRIP